MRSMIYLVVVVIVASSLGANAQQVPLSKPLNCQGVSVKPLVDLKLDQEHACNRLVSRNKDMDRLALLTLIEECLCNLVPRQVLWESMLTDQVTKLYSAIHKALDPDQERKETYQLPELTRLMQWRGFKNEVVSTINPWIDTRAWLKVDIPATCSRLSRMLEPVLTYIMAAQEASENPNLSFKMSLHEENFHKLFMVHEGCKYIVD